jgi:hypothetical protein
MFLEGQQVIKGWRYSRGAEKGKKMGDSYVAFYFRNPYYTCASIVPPENVELALYVWYFRPFYILRCLCKNGKFKIRNFHSGPIFYSFQNSVQQGKPLCLVS